MLRFCGQQETARPAQLRFVNHNVGNFMSMSKVGDHSAIVSSAQQPTTAEAAAHGPSKAATSSALQSLSSKARTVAVAGAGMAGRAAVPIMVAVSDMLMPVAEAAYHPGLGGAVAVGARNPRIGSADGSETAKKLGIALGVVAGAAGVVYASIKACQHLAGKNTTNPATQAPADAPAGNVNNV